MAKTFRARASGGAVPCACCGVPLGEGSRVTLWQPAQWIEFQLEQGVIASVESMDLPVVVCHACGLQIKEFVRRERVQ